MNAASRGKEAITKARIITTYKCLRNCAGCCNKQAQFSGDIDVVQNYSEYREIILTGGEPLLFHERLEDLIQEIRSRSPAKIYLYTAAVEHPQRIWTLSQLVDGITLTLHTKEDVAMFQRIVYKLPATMSGVARLNVFAEAGTPPEWAVYGWFVKSNITWIDNCPLPEGEKLLRLQNIW